MYLVALAWMYVVVLMSVAEAVSSQGSVLGALFTFVLYGVLPLAIVMFLGGTPARRRARGAARAAALSGPPDGGGQAAGDAVATERKES